MAHRGGESAEVDVTAREEAVGFFALVTSGGFDLCSAAIALLERRRWTFGRGDLAWLRELAREAAAWAHEELLALREQATRWNRDSATALWMLMRAAVVLFTSVAACGGNSTARPACRPLHGHVNYCLVDGQPVSCDARPELSAEVCEPAAFLDDDTVGCPHGRGLVVYSLEEIWIDPGRVGRSWRHEATCCDVGSTSRRFPEANLSPRREPVDHEDAGVWLVLPSSYLQEEEWRGEGVPGPTMQPELILRDDPEHGRVLKWAGR